jgi:hypothetical protein
MNLRKLISLCALLALFVAQISVAHHSAVHIDHGITHHQDAPQLQAENVSAHSDHDQQSKQHQCPECLLNKTLQGAFYNQQAALFHVLSSEKTTAPQHINFHTNVIYNANAARAPPRFLI